MFLWGIVAGNMISLLGGGGGGDKIAIIIGECCNVVNIIQSYDVCACFYKIDVRGRIFE